MPRYKLRTLLIVLALGPPCSADDAEVRELEKLQGEWVLHASEYNGKDNMPARTVTISIKNSEYAFDSDGQPLTVRFKLNVISEPKHFDSYWKSTRIHRGIYKLEGDTLTICHVYNGSGNHPSGFATTDQGNLLTVWKKIKSGDK